MFRDFNENPYRKDGLGPEQRLALALPVTEMSREPSAPARIWYTVKYRAVSIPFAILFSAHRSIGVVIFFTVSKPEQPTGLRRFLRLN